MEDLTVQPIPAWTPPVPPEQRVLAAMRALAQGDVYQVPMAVLAQTVGKSVRYVQQMVRRLQATGQVVCVANAPGGGRFIPLYHLRSEVRGEQRGEVRGEQRGEVRGEQRGEQRGEVRGEQRGEVRGEQRGEFPLTEIQAEISPLVPTVPDLHGSLDPNGSQIPNGKEKERVLRTPKKEKTPRPMVIPPPGFLRCWLAYPNFRRINKPKCLQIWTRDALEAQAETIAAHIQAMTATEEWTKEGGRYIPHFTSYLNGAHYETPPRPTPSRASNGTSPASGDRWDATIAYLKQRFPEEVQP